MNDIKRRKKETQYQLWIAKILNEDVTNVNISYPTVVDTRLSNDGSHLKIYVTFAKNEKKSLEALNATKGFIRTQLGKYDHSKKLPSLSFYIDEVSKNSQKIEELLNEINSKKDKE